MGVLKFPLVDQNFEENCDLINGSLLNNVLEAQAKSKTRVVNRKPKQKSYKNSHSMKRQQARLGLKANGVERRVRTLKRLIPHKESIGLDGLFRETADYILSLQMRVRVMQNLVKVLTGSDQE